ncbi:MAG: hypothetical protein R3185_07285 [Candidatus Thermoplasmatota archaeon]|nr:hypothetical protein [Candidatus Thermoplasmatota archaeon]
MRWHLLIASLLVIGLHVAGEHLAPPRVPIGALPAHLDHPVTLEGHVTSVAPGEHVTRLTLRDATGSATLLTRAPPPPIGARILATGAPAPDEGGLVVWLEGRARILEAPSPEPMALRWLLQEAPNLAGSPVATYGTVHENGAALSAPGATLTTRWVTTPPARGETVIAWGQLSYKASQGAYRLEVTGWTPWQPP